MTIHFLCIEALCIASQGTCIWGKVLKGKRYIWCHFLHGCYGRGNNPVRCAIKCPSNAGDSGRSVQWSQACSVQGPDNLLLFVCEVITC